MALFFPPRNPHASRWAEDPILDITLRDLFEKGLTFSEIAAGLWKFGHKFTRNAVIGRARRLCLPPRQPSGGKAKSPEHIRKINESRRGRSRKPAWTPAVERPANTVSTAGAFLGLSLLELADGDCRYPQGDKHVTFCGQPKLRDSAYCPTHHELCHIRSSGRWWGAT